MESLTTDQNIEDPHESTITLEEHLRRYSDNDKHEESDFSEIRETQDYKIAFEFIMNGTNGHDLSSIDEEIAQKTWWDIIAEYSDLPDEVHRRAGHVRRESAKKSSDNDTVTASDQSVAFNGLKTAFDGTESDQWRKLARCKGQNPDMFFPTRGISELDAKQFCSQCKVNEECLKYAVKKDIRYGIWGGLTETERRRFRRLKK